jgi:hypothetical protein
VASQQRVSAELAREAEAGWRARPRRTFVAAQRKARHRNRALPGFELPLQGSNLDSPDPESGVLPVTPRGSDCTSADWLTIRGNPFKIALVGCRFNPSHLPTEHTLSHPRLIGAADQARRATLLVPLLLALTGCRETFAGFGAGTRARASIDQLFGALSDRHADVVRSPKFEYARIQIGKGALLPSRVFSDTAAWTGSSGAVRLLEWQGSFVDGRYALIARSGAPAPRKPADGRHILTLSRLSDNEYRWDTTVDFALGNIRPSDVVSVLSRLIASAEGKSEREARADLVASSPRTSAALATAFSLDSLIPTALSDGSTAVTLVIAMRSDLLKRRYPAFGDYMRRYVDPARYRLVATDAGGVPFFEASAKDRLLTIRLRTHRGQLVALSGPARPLPDSLILMMDFKARIKHFGVGFHALRMDLVHVRHGDSDNEWVVTAQREPEWDFPLATARLIRAPLRRPFAGEGSLFRLGVRGDGAGPTVIVRQSRLFVQESAILRFLNSLSGTAFAEFADKVDREQNAWLREVFSAMRGDARAAIAAP